MATKYKLTYFSVMGLGEPIRLLLAYGGVEYEDFRFNEEDWPEMKNSMPFGKVPVLEIDGKVIHQSAAISRYLGKQFKIAGANDWEDLQCDMMEDAVINLRSQVYAPYYEKDKKRSEEMKEALIKESIPFNLKKFDEEIEKNSGHLVGGKLTWADLHIVCTLDSFQAYLKVNFMEDGSFPNMKALMDNVKSIPSIKSWIEKRLTLKLGKRRSLNTVEFRENHKLIECIKIWALFRC